MTAMRRLLLMLALLALAAVVACFGTIFAMEKGTLPAQYRLHLSTSATNYTVRVTWITTNEFPVSNTGDAVIDIPALPHSCSLVCLGVKLTDNSLRSRKIVEILRDGRVVQRLSVRELDRLVSEGSGTVRLHQ
jgi:hypothetical protein